MTLDNHREMIYAHDPFLHIFYQPVAAHRM